jgi:hypothetical protein
MNTVLEQKLLTDAVDGLVTFFELNLFVGGIL